MSLSEDVSVELMRQLRITGQMQHAWVTYAWQNQHGGLHPAAAMLLSDLAVHGESRPSELAKRRMVNFSVISRQIGQLSAAGLIDRRPAPEDGGDPRADRTLGRHAQLGVPDSHADQRTRHGSRPPSFH
jgi:DNA-binding MarR family transcriptional regulator